MTEPPRRYPRFSRIDRAEHLILLASFTTLALTGLVQKFAEAGVSQTIIGLLGGIETTRLIHRVAAVVLMLEGIFHLGTVSYKLLVRRVRFEMVPGLDDARAAVQAFLHNLGLRRQPPQEGRYTFAEKAEYWAVVWGTVVMAITGFMMWNPISTARFLPGEAIPAAKAAHGFEAILAVLAILLWHMYHVHLRRFNRSMFTGDLSEDEMLEEHPLELADLKAGTARRPVDPRALARRRRLFFPVFSVVALVLLAGVYAFASYEQTAITTLPQPVEGPVFVPLTPTPFPTSPPSPTPAPSATPAPTAAMDGEAPTPEVAAVASWVEDIAPLLQAKCAACHGPAALGGLDLTSYETTLAGGANGPAVVPGDVEASLLVRRQQAGGHPGQLTPEELEAVIAWVLAGAPE
jgi:formate dehydrogenase gamma subunit